MDRVDDEMIVGEIRAGRGEGGGRRMLKRFFSIAKYKWDGRHDIENQAIVVLPQEVLSSRSSGINRRGGRGGEGGGGEKGEIRWTNESQRDDGNAH